MYGHSEIRGRGETVSYKFVRADINILKVYSNMLGYSQKVIDVNYLHMTKFNPWGTVIIHFIDLRWILGVKTQVGSIGKWQPGFKR